MPSFHFLKIHLNIILPFTHRSSKWSLFLTFPHQNPAFTSPLPHAGYVLNPPHYSRFDHPNNIWCGVQIIHLPIMQFPPLSCYPVPLTPNIPLNTLFSSTLSLRTSLSVCDQVSQTYKTTGKIIVLYTLIFIFLDNKDFNLLLIYSWMEFWFFKVVLE